ncbi:hypothetical protein FACS1894216_06870 [Synergistales bacterium]|nr:hypothetical protein FACS1894216_06870 [Synergistales bacterium]
MAVMLSNTAQDVAPPLPSSRNLRGTDSGFSSRADAARGDASSGKNSFASFLKNQNGNGTEKTRDASPDEKGAPSKADIAESPQEAAEAAVSEASETANGDASDVQLTNDNKAAELKRLSKGALKGVTKQDRLLTKDVSASVLEDDALKLVPYILAMERVDAAKDGVSLLDAGISEELLGRAKQSRFNPEAILGEDDGLHELIDKFMQKYAPNSTQETREREKLEESGVPGKGAADTQADPEAAASKDVSFLDVLIAEGKSAAGELSAETAEASESEDKPLSAEDKVWRDAAVNQASVGTDKGGSANVNDASSKEDKNFAEQLAEDVPAELIVSASETEDKPLPRASEDTGDKTLRQDAAVNQTNAGAAKDDNSARTSDEGGKNSDTDLLSRKPANVKAKNTETADKAERDGKPAHATERSFAHEIHDILRGTAQTAQRDFENALNTREMTRPGLAYTLAADNAFDDGLNSVLQFMRQDGVDEARIVVEPPSLGRIDVSLHATASGVEAAFKVDNEALKQTLQTHIEALKTSLEAQGIHVSSISVDIGDRDSQRNRGNGAQKGKRKINGIEAYEEEESARQIARLDLEKGLLHWVA